MASDTIRHLPASRIPLFRDNGPRPDPAGEADYIKSAAALHAQLRERDRAEADAAAPPHQQKSSAATPQANRPVMSHEQREAEREIGDSWRTLLRSDPSNVVPPVAAATSALAAISSGGAPVLDVGAQFRLGLDDEVAHAGLL